MHAYMTTEEIISASMELRIGGYRLGVLDLAKVVEDQGPVGESIRNFILRTRIDHALRPFELGFINMFKLTDGPGGTQDMWRVLSCVKQSPLIIIHESDSHRHDQFSEDDGQGHTLYKDTQYGPVVEMKLPGIMAGASFTFFLNPKGLNGFEFLSALYSFPLITVCSVNNTGMSIQQLSRPDWPDEVMTILNATTHSKAQQEDRNFVLAVEAARQIPQG